MALSVLMTRSLTFPLHCMFMAHALPRQHTSEPDLTPGLLPTRIVDGHLGRFALTGQQRMDDQTF